MTIEDACALNTSPPESRTEGHMIAALGQQVPAGPPQVRQLTHLPPRLTCCCPEGPSSPS